MRFSIRYGLRFAYDEPVWESQNEIRVRPRETVRQRLVSHRLVTRPGARVLSFTDYWGTSVDHVGIRARHQSLDVASEAVVDTIDAPGDERVSADLESDLSEYLTTSSHTEASPAVADAARLAVTGIDDPVARAEAVVEGVRAAVSYAPGSTGIGVSPDDVLRLGAGVCQDYTHLSLAMLRSLGAPARYVSGYLFAADETTLDDGQGPIEVRVQTHAWIEVAVPGLGWLGLDPTNGTNVGRRHIVIGHGRDYDDVPPVVGVYAGAGTPDVDAEVLITRIDDYDDDSRRVADSARPGLQSGSPWGGAHQQQQQQ